jgi:hypothetical protein
MSCTYASVEIQRTPDFRIFKRCLFYDKPCSEVRAAKMCPLMKRGTAAQPPAPTSRVPAADRAVLSDELQRIDSIPVKTGVTGRREADRREATEKTEAPQPKGPSDAELLRAELSDFISILEAKEPKQEIPTPRQTPAPNRAAPKRTTPRRTIADKKLKSNQTT